MSYVPATFTAGFALMLTAAGAVAGQWVSDIQHAVNERPPAKTEARLRVGSVSVVPTPRVTMARETPGAAATIEAIEALELHDLQAAGIPAIVTLHAPGEKPPLKIASGDAVGKPRSSRKKKS